MSTRLAFTARFEPPPGPETIQAEFITERAELAQLGEDWERLAAAELHAGVFVGLGFHRALWEAFAPSARLMAVVLRRDGRVCGILPLERRLVRRRAVVVRELRFLRNPHVLGNCLLLGEAPQVALQAALELLRRAGGWDVVLLEHVVPPREGLGFVAQAASAAGLALDPWRVTRTMDYLPVEGTFEAYIQGLTKKFRSQLRGYERDAAALGPVSYERLDQPTAIRAALPAVFALEQRSRKGDDARTAMGQADHRFHLRLTETLPPDQVGELWLMRIGERLVAALRLLRHHDTLHAHVIYFDAEQAAVSPGKLIVREVLRSAWERGLAEVDFHGDSLFITRWTNHKRTYLSTRLYAHTPYGWILRQALHLARHWRGESDGHD